MISFHSCIQQKVPSSATISAFGKFASFPRRFIWHSENTGGFLHHSYQQIVNVILELTDVAVLLLELLLVFHQLLQDLLVSEVSVPCSGIERISFLQVIQKNTRFNEVFPEKLIVIAFYVSLDMKSKFFQQHLCLLQCFSLQHPHWSRQLEMGEHFPLCHLRKKFSQWGGHTASVSELVTI